MIVQPAGDLEPFVTAGACPVRLAERQVQLRAVDVDRPRGHHVAHFLAQGVPPDYSSNTWPRSVPTGLDTEVFSVAALRRADKAGRAKRDREHVTLYMKEHPEEFDRKQQRDRQAALMKWHAWKERLRRAP